MIKDTDLLVRSDLVCPLLSDRATQAISKRCSCVRS